MLADILVVVGALGGAGFLAWFFFGSRAAAETTVTSGVQEATVVVQGGYSPNLIQARRDVPLRIHFDRREGSDCTSRVIFPDFNVSKSLPAFATTTLELVPKQHPPEPVLCLLLQQRRHPHRRRRTLSDHRRAAEPRVRSRSHGFELPIGARERVAAQSVPLGKLRGELRLRVRFKPYLRHQLGSGRIFDGRPPGAPPSSVRRKSPE